ncbi:MAG: bifunctional folylpolyglutamate synthase/dihydrofolate synthase [Phycisphaerales bacterium]|nr:bifunctional folylpolyglutamate synthase/dihydrofolate synthase [Hyphomonadaceae bacterium]
MTDQAPQTFERLFGPEFGHGKALNLLRLREALRQLGAPQTRLPPVLHVAGTNGKGSTIAFMRAIAEAAGLKVHAFTKPHLFALNERFLVAGEIVSDQALIAAAERVGAIDYGLTHFDAQVAAALLLFSEAPADLVLLETGMGGRDDSTNVIDRPALSVITPIGFDHQDALGASLVEIANHKAGILKAGAPAILARQPDEARLVLVDCAAAVGAPLLRQGVEWDAYAYAGRLVVQTESRALDLPLPALHGAHQIDNAGLACIAMMQWREFDDSAFSAGISWARWPGRLQPLTRGPLSAPAREMGGEVWVDGGHNAHAAAALAVALTAMQRKRPLNTVAIVGMLPRKDAGAFVAALAPGINELIAVEAAHNSAQIVPLMQAAEAHGLLWDCENSIADAITYATRNGAARVLICGSFVVAAEALAAESA